MVGHPDPQYARQSTFQKANRLYFLPDAQRKDGKREFLGGELEKSALQKVPYL
jgi:hypothetical protein